MAKYKTPTMSDLLDAGVHFGHQIKRWHPGMERYIFAQRMGIHIVDLEQTEQLLNNACEFLYNVASEGGNIVLVGTKRQAKDVVKSEAQRSGAYYVNERWLGGTITNFPIISKNIKKLVNLKTKREQGEFSKYTKKERLLLDRQIDKLEKLVGGIVGLSGRPQAIVVIDSRREKTAIKEANASNVPVVALIDTNSNPEGIDYVIPGNDDAIRAIVLIAKALGDAIEEGYKAYANSTKVKPKESSSAEEDIGNVPVVVSGATASHVSETAGKDHVKDVRKLVKDLDDLKELDKDVQETVENDDSPDATSSDEEKVSKAKKGTTNDKKSK